MIKSLKKYGKFKKMKLNGNCSKEKMKEIINELLLDDGIVDLSDIDSIDTILYLLETVKQSCVFVHTNKDLVDEVSNTSIYKIKQLINKHNIEDIIGSINKKIDFLNFNFVLDLENMNEEQLMVLEKIKDLPLEKYFSDKIWGNQFIDLSNTELLDYLNAFEDINKNNCFGNIPCNECNAFGFCSQTPEQVKNIKNVFNKNSICKCMQKLSEKNIFHIIEAEKFKDIVECVSKDIDNLGQEMANNNVFINELTLAIIKLVNSLKGE